MTGPSDPSLAERFRAVVDGAVAPVMAKRERGSFTIYYEPHLMAKAHLSVGELVVHYMLFQSEAAGKDTGLQGLRFVPSHAVELVEMNSFLGRTTRQSMFGLRRDGTFVRAMAAPGPLGPSGFGPSRELDERESAAFVQFAEAPHLPIDKLGVILQLTPEEAAQQATLYQRDLEAADSFRTQMEAIDKLSIRPLDSNYLIR